MKNAHYCSDCGHWNDAQWVMNEYGEGCGKCMISGEVTFCSYRACPAYKSRKRE